jgi:hypothetical protein
VQHDERRRGACPAIQQLQLPPGNSDEAPLHATFPAALRAASQPKASPRISDTPAW